VVAANINTTPPPQQEEDLFANAPADLFANAPPPATKTEGRQPPSISPASITDVSWYKPDEGKLNANQLKKVFTTAAQSSEKKRRLPLFPEEEAMQDKPKYLPRMRMTESMAMAIRLMDVETVRVLLSIGFKADTKLEDRHDRSPTPLELVGLTWKEARRERVSDSESFHVYWDHPTGTKERKQARLAELFCIAKLLLLKGAQPTEEALQVLQELRVGHKDDKLAELVMSFPTQADLDAVFSLPQSKTSEKEKMFRVIMAKVRALHRAESAKRTDPSKKAEADKMYKKSLKKLPRAVVKKHIGRRITPLYSPMLRTSEQMYLACMTFDCIAIHNYTLRGHDPDAVLECWNDNNERLSPTEVMCKYWVSGQDPQPRASTIGFVEYSRSVTEEDCIDCLSTMLAYGASVSNRAKELSAGKSEVLDDLLAGDKLIIKAASKGKTIKTKKAKKEDSDEEDEASSKKKKSRFGTGGGTKNKKFTLRRTNKKEKDAESVPTAKDNKGKGKKKKAGDEKPKSGDPDDVSSGSRTIEEDDSY